MDVSENSGTPKSSILVGFSIINHPFWGAPILETPIYDPFLLGTYCTFQGFLKPAVDHSLHGSRNDV